MSIQTNLAGRIRNTTLPRSKALLPLFEAIVNSIHSIEEANLPPDKGIIEMEILREPYQGPLRFENGAASRNSDSQGEISGFKITDNGIGFTDENMRSFETLDSEHKVKKGCRGIGRLLWLRAFDAVHISSVFVDHDKASKIRNFKFSTAGIDAQPVSKVSPARARSTIVHLDGFKPYYRNNSRKTLISIARSILDHCLWYFIREGGSPDITICDDGELISLQSLYNEYMHDAAKAERLIIKGLEFDLLHIKFRSSLSSYHTIAFAADNRLVSEEKLSGKIQGLHGKLTDEHGEFIYTCYVTSPYLNEHVLPERTGFDIPEKSEAAESEIELIGPEPSFQEIRKAVTTKISEHLAEQLKQTRQRAKNRVENFVKKRAPRYRPILNRIPEENLHIDPEISDKDLELHLHKQLYELESQLLAEGHSIMKPALEESADEYQKRVESYLSKAADIKKSDLASYVSHRKVIIELLESAIQKGHDGKYKREEWIHRLIMPMQYTSDDVFPDQCNLWLIDERLAFHDYLSSDKTINSMPITGCSDTKEPDLCAFNIFDNPVLVSETKGFPLETIVIVEIKRPMRNDFASGESKDPVEQVLGYLNRIRDGRAQTPGGRPIPESQNIPGFCYILADITSTLKDRCINMHDMVWTQDGMGFFAYKKNLNAYIEVISFDKLIKSAKERNKAFFDKLGLPTD